VRESRLESITLDADSTVKSVCGNQEGAKSYHPLLVFVSEMKLLYHTWFRTGSAYTANGVVEFLKEVHSSMPRNIRKVFFRADSGFFSGICLIDWNPFWAHGAILFLGLSGKSKAQEPGGPVDSPEY